MREERKALNDPEFLTALLDVAIPASDSRGLPSAGRLGLEDDVVSGLRGDSMLGPMVVPVLEALREAALAAHPDGLSGMMPEESKKLVEAQVASNPFLMMGLLRYLYPAYYGQASVLEAIGEPPRPPFPEGFEVEPTDPELLAKLEERSRKA